LSEKGAADPPENLGKGGGRGCLIFQKKGGRERKSSGGKKKITVKRELRRDSFS